MPARPLAVLVSALLLFGLGPGASLSRGAGGDEVIRQLAQSWLARLERQRPDLASHYGIRRAAERLAPVTDVTLDSDAGWIPTLRARLTAAGAASPAMAADRDALLAWCAAESAAVAPDGRWRRDPGAYVEMIEDALNEPASATRPGTCERANRAAKRLAEVPEVLRGAQIALRQPERAATERAVARLDSLIATWRTGLPQRFAACREPYRQADLIVADSTAIRSAAGFAAWLRDDVLPGTTPGPAAAARTPLPHLATRPR